MRIYTKKKSRNIPSVRLIVSFLIHDHEKERLKSVAKGHFSLIPQGEYNSAGAIARVCLHLEVENFVRTELLGKTHSGRSPAASAW